MHNVHKGHSNSIHTHFISNDSLYGCFLSLFLLMETNAFMHSELTRLNKTSAFPTLNI
jgi:hypothetical protein